jgi:hypothetical protein
MLKSHVQVAPFKEHPITDHSIAEPNEFDVIAFAQAQAPDFIISDKFSLEQYCTCLLHRLFLLDKSDIKPFIQYQCEKLNEPLIWLNKFEKLIDINRDIFTKKEQNIKVEKALVLIELFRQEIQNNKFSTAAQYSFDKVQKKIKEYPTTEEKLSYLMEAKTKYLQNKPQLINPNEVPFNEKIDLEIILLKDQDKLSKKRQKTFAVIENKSPLGPLKKSPQSPDKFKINTNLNQFVDIFFQLTHEKKVDGKPYLEASPNELAEMIATWFKDKEGKEISIDTIKTILKPSRIEKRPKGNSRFDVI